MVLSSCGLRALQSVRGFLGGNIRGKPAMRFNNNNLDEVHVHMAFYIHMPQGFPRTKFLILVVDG